MIIPIFLLGYELDATLEQLKGYAEIVIDILTTEFNMNTAEPEEEEVEEYVLALRTHRGEQVDAPITLEERQDFTVIRKDAAISSEHMRSQLEELRVRIIRDDLPEVRQILDELIEEQEAWVLSVTPIENNDESAAEYIRRKRRLSATQQLFKAFRAAIEE